MPDVSRRCLLCSVHSDVSSFFSRETQLSEGFMDAYQGHLFAAAIAEFLQGVVRMVKHVLLKLEHVPG